MIISPVFTQILPTIPKNVFRFSTGYYHNTGEWILNNQHFNLNGIGRRYFNDKIYDEYGVFNSNHDLFFFVISLNFFLNNSSICLLS